MALRFKNIKRQYRKLFSYSIVHSIFNQSVCLPFISQVYILSFRYLLKMRVAQYTSNQSPQLLQCLFSIAK